MTIPGIALFISGYYAVRMFITSMTQVMLIFSVVIILWIMFGYSLAFTGNKIWGGWSLTFLNNISVDSVAGEINQYVHVVFQGSLRVITVA